jgi:predicted transcriptional regulator YheO
LKRPDRVALVAALEEQGLFKTRNAVDHLASLIGTSRASIYNYLSAARDEGAA